MSSAASSVVVVGGGLAGLSASVHLRRMGIPHRVFERDAYVGGLSSTTEEAGYRFDRTGHLLHLRDPAMRAFVFEMLDPSAWLEIDRKSVIHCYGVTTKYPFQANVHGLPKEVAYECVRDFVRAHHEPSEGPVRTFEDYCLRHFGAAMSRHFMVPYNEKLWGVHPREISVEWCDRFVPRPSIDQVLRGAFGVAGEELGYNVRFLYPRMGMGELARAMAERAVPIERGIGVSGVDVLARRVRAGDEWVPYDTLISSIPLTDLVDRLVDPPPEIVAARRKLRATSLQYIDLALNTPCERPWHWVYVPEPRFSFYRVGCYTSFSPAMAPPGKASLYVELADRKPIELRNRLPAIAEDLVEIGLIRAPEAIRFARLRRIDPAYVIYDDAREASVRLVRAYLAEHGISSIGRYGAWEYSSMEDALATGAAAARQAADAIQGDADR